MGKRQGASLRTRFGGGTQIVHTREVDVLGCPAVTAGGGDDGSSYGGMRQCTSASGGRTESCFLKRADVGAVRVPGTRCAEMDGSAARRQAGLPGRAPRGNRPFSRASASILSMCASTSVSVSRARRDAGNRMLMRIRAAALGPQVRDSRSGCSSGLPHVVCHSVCSCSKRSRKGTMPKKQSCRITPLRSPCQTAL